MSTTTLPKRGNPVKATRVGPKIIILYSLPKVGKTDALTQLAAQQDCLIFDLEGGTQTYDTTSVQIKSVKGLKDVVAQLDSEGLERQGKGLTGMDMFPYKFLALDTLDKLEDLVEPYATALYKQTVIGKKFEGKSVLELPQGAGYYYIREAMKEIIDLLASRCPYLILIVHVKEKMMLDKMNQEVKVNDISLSGKLSSIVCAMADAISYLYRNKQGELRMSFNTHDGAVMGARQKYLAGKDLPFDWKTIYPEVFGETKTEQDANLSS